MTRTVAFFAAMAVEAEPFRQLLGEPTVALDQPGLEIITGSLSGSLSGSPFGGLSGQAASSAVVAVTGIGKVGMAAAVQHVCDRYQPALLLIGGLAGSLQPTRPGELVIATAALQHDYDAQPVASAPALLPQLGLDWFVADAVAVEQMAAACAAVESGLAVTQAAVLSGDRLIRVAAERDAIAARYPLARCVDMESGALGQIALQNGVPWAGLRVVSDSADESVSGAGLLEFGAGGASHAVANILVRAAAGYLAATS